MFIGSKNFNSPYRSLHSPEMAEADLAARDYSFCPSNDRLVDRYLRAKIDDGKISDHANACFFHDADVGSAPPQELVLNCTPTRVPCTGAGDGQAWYFFSPARFVGTSLKKRSRTIAGTDDKESWHAEACPKPVEGSAGGYVQMFSYHVRMAPKVVEKPGWIMAEYTFKDTRPGDVVLCKIYKSPRGPGRTKAASSSCKRKAADDVQHLEAATPSTRPRLQTGDDDVMLFAANILLSDEDHAAGVDGNTMQLSLQEMETLLMTEEKEDNATTIQVPDGEDPVAFWTRCLLGNEEQGALLLPRAEPVEDAAVQTVHGPLTDYDVIAALATGLTVGELLLDSPSTSGMGYSIHRGGAPGVLCA